MAGVVSVLLIAVTAGWYAVRSTGDRPEFHFGGIACSEVHQAMPAYLAGDLDETVVQKIDTHLAECPHCQKYIQEMHPANAHASVQTSDQPKTTLVAARF